MKLLQRAVRDLENEEYDRREQYAEQLGRARENMRKDMERAEKAAKRAEKDKKDEGEDDQSRYEARHVQQQYIKIGGHLFSPDPALPDPDFTYCSLRARRSEE